MNINQVGSLFAATGVGVSEKKTKLWSPGAVLSAQITNAQGVLETVNAENIADFLLYESQFESESKGYYAVVQTGTGSRIVRFSETETSQLNAFGFQADPNAKGLIADKGDLKITLKVLTALRDDDELDHNSFEHNTVVNGIVKGDRTLKAYIS